MQRTGFGAYSSPDITAAALKDQDNSSFFPFFGADQAASPVLCARYNSKHSKEVLENRGDGGRMGFPILPEWAEKREGRK